MAVFIGATKRHGNRSGVFYLNNTGSRWVVLENGIKPKITLETKSGKMVEKTPLYYESFGNFAVAAIKHKGKVIKVFPDTKIPD
jgi:hypothetical protein